jgi:hypothetical protein
MNDRDFAKVLFSVFPPVGTVPKTIEMEDHSTALAKDEIGPAGILGVDHVDRTARNIRGNGERAIKIFVSFLKTTHHDRIKMFVLILNMFDKDYISKPLAF